MSTFLILPNQLFEKKFLNKNNNFVIWEHPHYFKSYKYNKKKLLLHRASMKYYYDYLKESNYKVKYIEFNKNPGIDNYCLFDPIDKIKLPKKYEIIESPNFILTKKDYEVYRNKSEKFFFNAFYMWGKKEIDVIPTVKSQDKHNRKKLSKNIKVPKLS